MKISFSNKFGFILETSVILYKLFTWKGDLSQRSDKELKHKFAAIQLNFIYLPFLKDSSKKIEELLCYYFPQLNYYNIPEEVSKIYNEKVLNQIFSNGAEDFFQIFDTLYLFHRKPKLMAQNLAP